MLAVKAAAVVARLPHNLPEVEAERLRRTK